MKTEPTLALGTKPAVPREQFRTQVQSHSGGVSVAQRSAKPGRRAELGRGSRRLRKPPPGVKGPFRTRPSFFLEQ